MGYSNIFTYGKINMKYFIYNCELNMPKDELISDKCINCFIVVMALLYLFPLPLLLCGHGFIVIMQTIAFCCAFILLFFFNTVVWWTCANYKCGTSKEDFGQWYKSYPKLRLWESSLGRYLWVLSFRPT